MWIQVPNLSLKVQDGGRRHENMQYTDTNTEITEHTGLARAYHPLACIQCSTPTTTLTGGMDRRRPSISIKLKVRRVFVCVFVCYPTPPKLLDVSI